MDTEQLTPRVDRSIVRISGFHEDPVAPDYREALHDLIRSHAPTLPLPGSGETLRRWRIFAAIAEQDLTCAKLFESHADALAILNELGQCRLVDADQLWAVWCAEPPTHRVAVSSMPSSNGTVRIDGTKAWCSGAALVSHALIGCWDDAGRQHLAAVDMDQPGVQITSKGWNAVGMGSTGSVDVAFKQAVGTLVDTADRYVNRPGFLHGAAGVAACWYGAATAIAAYVVDAARRRPDDAHAMAHLGALDVALAQASGLLSAAAQEIDSKLDDACSLAVRRARLAVESAVETVLLRAPRALGAGPLCKNYHLARLMADLPVFLRQSHAERDQAVHGRALAEWEGSRLWAL